MITDKKFYFITGNHPGLSTNTLSNSQIIAADKTLSVVPATNIIAGIPNIRWTRGLRLSAFGTPAIEDVPNYVNHNGNVYVCLSTNDKNLLNYTNFSAYAPTHTNGMVRYDDGFLFLYLFSITSNVNKFIGSHIPVPGWDALKTLVDTTEATESLCESGTTGSCVFYQKPVDFDDEYTASILSPLTISGVSCEACSSLAVEITRTNRLLVRFFPTGTSTPSTIDVENYATKLDSLITSKTINSKLNFQAKAYVTAKTSGISAGGILQTFIDKSTIDGVSASYSIIPGNTVLTFSGGGGTGCAGSFITTANANGTLNITGISVSGGSGYLTPPTIGISADISVEQRDTILNNLLVINSIPSNTFSNISSIFDVPSSASVGYQKSINIIHFDLDTQTVDNNFYGLISTAANTKSTNAQDLLPNIVRVFPVSAKNTTNTQRYSINFISP